MNTITKFNLSITLLVAMMFFLTTNCSAQQRQGRGQGQPPIPDESQIVKIVDDLSSELSLSDNQETEILALYQDHFADVKSSMSSGQRPDRDEMESMKEEFEENVKSVLNDEQKDLYDEYIENNKPRQDQGRERQRR